MNGDPKELREKAVCTSGGRAFQAEGIAEKRS